MSSRGQKILAMLKGDTGKLQKIRESNGDFSSEVGGSETVKELIENDSPVNEKNEIPLENSKILLEGQTYENSLLADENVIFEEVANVYEVIELQGEAEVSVSKKPRIELEIDDTEWNSDDSLQDPDFNCYSQENYSDEDESSSGENNAEKYIKKKKKNKGINKKNIPKKQINNERMEILEQEEKNTNMQQVIQVENIQDFVVEQNVTTENFENENDEIIEPVPKPFSRRLRKERTLKRNSGKQYVTAKGKVIKSRKLKDLRNCRLRCRDWLTQELRETIFKEYWGQQSHSKRVGYINKLVTSGEVNTRRVRKDNSNKSRNVTYNYAFEIGGQRRKVCKSCFQGTINETEKFIRNCLGNKKNSVTGIVKDDLRGKHAPSNKTTELQRQDILAHIDSFPKYESHYTRRVNDKKYLPSDLNLLKMYNLYRESHENPVGRKIYEQEFHKLKLDFKKPKTDLCHRCEVLQMQIQLADKEEEINDLKEAQNRHHIEADTAYECKKRDKEEAKNSNLSRCYTFDLQQCLPTPYLETSVSFYKRNYWTYNLTIHDCASGYASCYLWHETIAMRGANEIASCLYKELMILPPEVKKITLYSDTCGGQNKNFHVAAMFLALMAKKPSLEEINHKFMMSGHSHMECDCDHSLIEKQKKRSGMKISHPHDWATLIRCTNKAKPFNVIEMTQNHFFDFANLLKTSFVRKQKNSEGEIFKLHDCKWLRYTKKPGIIFYRYSLTGEEIFKELNLNRRGRPTNLLEIKNRYENPLPIAAEKKAHLLELLPLVHEEYRNFYENLPTNAQADRDPDLEEFNPEEY